MSFTALCVFCFKKLHLNLIIFLPLLNNQLPFSLLPWVTEPQLCFPPGPPPPPEFPLKIHKKSVGLLIYSNIISTFAPRAEKLQCCCDLSAFFIQPDLYFSDIFSERASPAHFSFPPNFSHSIPPSLLVS